MKTLEPKIRYKCDFCKRIYIIKYACIEHEKECYRNPNRDCPTCLNQGVQMLDTLDPHTLGVIPDGDERDCPACIIAQKYGGKSYL